MTRLTLKWLIVLALMSGSANAIEPSLVEKAQKGDAVAQNNLGLKYYNGDGVPKDSTEAVKWYRKSAEQGNANAQLLLGAMYATGDGIPKDSNEAVKWVRKAAEQGNADGQYCLGAMYDLGIGVLEDKAEAAKWYRMAAAQGNASAQSNLVKLLVVSAPTSVANKSGMADGIPEAIIYVVVAGVVAMGLFWLIASRRRAETPAQLGRQWFAWSTAIVTVTLLPKFIRQLERESFISWLIGVVVLGGLVFLIGWLYGCFRFSNQESSPASSTAPKVSVPTIQPAAQPTVPQSASPAILSDGGRRLAELKEIFERGLITKQEYDSKRETIIAQL